MTDTIKRPEWHSTSDGVRDAEVTDLRRRLADAELRAMRAVSAEDHAQFSFETVKRRADRAETALRAVLVEYVIEPAAGSLEGPSDGVDSAEVPDSVLESIAASLVDDLVVPDPLPVGELPEAARGHLNGWAEETR